MIPTVRSGSASRTRCAANDRDSGVPCEKFRRATFMPAATSSSTRSIEAGPMVQTSFVRRIS